MRLTFIGSGSAFTVGDGNYQSNMLLTDDRKNLLIDCGSDARHALFELGYSYKDIDAVYISHLHADHIGGLEWLAFTSHFDPECKKPTLFISESIVDDLWNHVLSGGLGQKANLSTYFDVQPLQDSFRWQTISFSLIPAKHSIKTFGLTCEHFFITADTQFAPDYFDRYYKTARIIFQDCETAEVKTKTHAHYDELKQLPLDIKKKMWLYHYNPGNRPEPSSDGFLGFVKKGQSFV